ncbi:PAS domain-containing sensor histidine kinase [Teichococcus vastitatis]|uniref:PAS domain-containing sensor histidine kinase n=1 Tax=Teichococcus vastitatis TaxID=2307076 RepID=UPI000E7202C3|nr:PAS domain-containing sensor histidine kinase [Pseudoroseomonas vastitatis]
MSADQAPWQESTEEWAADAAFLRGVLSSSGDCIKVLDLDGRLLFMSDGGRRIMEIDDFEAVRGCPWPEFWQGRQRADAEAAVATARAGGIGRFQGTAPTMAGTLRQWDVQVTPILGADGRPERLLSVSRDVTLTRQAEAELRESEARFRNMADHAPVMMWVTDPTGYCTYLNRRWHEFTGQTEAEARGLGWTKATHPDDQRRAEDAFMSANTAQAPFRVEYRLRRADGTYRWAIDAASPRFGEDGAFLGYVGSVIDIDERREAEEALRASEARFQAITNSVEQLIWSTRPDGYHDYYNERWYEYTGLVPGSTDGEAWNGVFHPEDRERAWTVWRRSLETGEPYHIEYRLRHRSGQYRWVLGRAQPVRDGEGRITRWFGSCTDIEEIVQAREVLTRSRAELTREVEARTEALMAAEAALRQSQKMEAVGQLTGGLAHDFNNLITGVTGSLELLTARVAQGRLDNIDRYVNAAQDAARRAAALTHRLLAFSRRQTLDPKPTNVNLLIAGMAELVQRTVGPGIRVETAAAVGLWHTLVDRGQLENALLNLCINARDALPEGGKLAIETANCFLDERAAREWELPPGQYVSLSVADNGTGMPPDVASRAFDPFFTTKPIGQGTGLGLSMIYGFARQSNGQVRIASEVGQGTTVHLYLPRYTGETSDAEAVPEQATAAPSAASGKTVLVVDDEPTVRMLVVEVLEELGYTALEAADGEAGLRILRSDARIDLLVSDVGLPGGMNGRQVADAARAIRCNLKVLFITGYAENAVLSHGHLDAGMHVMTKPFTIRALAERIQALVPR